VSTVSNCICMHMHLCMYADCSERIASKGSTRAVMPTEENDDAKVLIAAIGRVFIARAWR